jgi:hypothetical protein
MRREAAVKRYEIIRTRLGPTAIAYAASGRVVNVINGGKNDTIETVRLAAMKHWPNAKEKR